MHFDDKTIEQALEFTLHGTNPLDMVSHLANGMRDVIEHNPDIEEHVKRYYNAMYYSMLFYLELLFAVRKSEEK